MRVRGAPLIGVTAAFGMALSLQKDTSDDAQHSYRSALLATRPTAVNLRWALDRMDVALKGIAPAQMVDVAFAEAQAIADEDANSCLAIGEQGLHLLRELADSAAGRSLSVMTHCNAGSLATVQWGTALAPIYLAAREGIDIHVWVSETRPRNQGSALTAWELAQAGISHTLVADNACGHLLSTGQVDACIVGSDRTLASGDVCNKIGTYLKAVAAHDNGIPFYVALPESTIDWDCEHPDHIPIEERAADELTHVTGMDAEGKSQRVSLSPALSPAANPAFDVTPARLVSRLITERGCYRPDELQVRGRD